MPKLYYPTDEIQGARPLNENLWFPRQASIILPFVNTNEGRDTWGLAPWRKEPYPIVRLNKNLVTHYLGYQNGRHYYKTSCYVGARFGNIARLRWSEIKAGLARTAFQQMTAWPTLGATPRLTAARFTTTTAYPDPDPETATQDFRVAHRDGGGSSAWATLHDGAGTDVWNNEASFGTRIRAGTVEDNWFDIIRIIFSFDFRALTDTDNKDSATCEFAASATTNDFTSSVSMVKSAPANATNGVAGDFNSITGIPGAMTKQASDIPIGGLTANSSTYNPMTMNATGLGNISLVAISEFGLVISDDANDVEPDPSGTGNDVSDVTIIGAETGGSPDTVADPKIVLVHSPADILQMAGVGYTAGSHQPAPIPIGVRPY